MSSDGGGMGVTGGSHRQECLWHFRSHSPRSSNAGGESQKRSRVPLRGGDTYERTSPSANGRLRPVDRLRGVAAPTPSPALRVPGFVGLCPKPCGLPAFTRSARGVNPLLQNSAWRGFSSPLRIARSAILGGEGGTVFAQVASTVKSVFAQVATMVKIGFWE